MVNDRAMGAWFVTASVLLADLLGYSPVLVALLTLVFVLVFDVLDNPLEDGDPA